MKEKIDVVIELQARKSWMLFEKPVSPNKLRKLKPLVDKLKYDCRKELYSCTADVINEMCKIQQRLKFNMELKVLDDAFMFKFGSGSEYLNAILHYSANSTITAPNILKTKFREKESTITLMLLASPNKNDEVVATW